jgi:DNA-binding NtrC family response regulator
LATVREHKPGVVSAAALADAETIVVWNLPDSIDAAPPTADRAPAEVATPVGAAPAAGFRPVSEELRELERRRIVEALSACNGVQRRAADLISMPIRTFSLKLKQYGLKDD